MSDNIRMRMTLGAQSVFGLGALFTPCEPRTKRSQCGAANAFELRAAIGFVYL